MPSAGGSPRGDPSAGAETSMAKLLIKDEQGERVYELTKDVTTAGRSSRNDIQIHDAKASRHQFRVEKDGDGYKMVDLESTNGTKLSGERITVHRLRPGDVLTVGRCALTYDGPGEPAKPEEKKSAAGGPKYVLAVVAGPDEGKQYELGLEAVTLGRHSSSTVRLEDEAASNYHAEIKKEPIGYVLSDLGSTNGTRLKGPGAREYEKIVKQPLAVGAQIRIGKTVIEFRNIGRPAEDDQIFGTVALDPSELGDEPAAPPARRNLPKAAAAVAFALVIFAGVVFIVHRMVKPNVQPIPPPPRPDLSNRLRNASFSEGTDDRGRPLGWDPKPGEPGIKITCSGDGEHLKDKGSEQGAGLVINKNGAKTLASLSVVENDEPFVVEAGKVYELSGWLANTGDGLYGLRVTWLKGERGGRTSSEHPVVLAGEQKWKEKVTRVRAPGWADRARAGVFAEGREGKACFDDLSFREIPGERLPEPPVLQQGAVSIGFEGTKGGFGVACGGLPALEQGLLELVNKDGKAITSLLSALDPVMDAKAGRVVYTGQLYDFAVQRATNYKIAAAPGASSPELTLAVDPTEGLAPRLAFYLVGGAAKGDVEWANGDKVERLTSEQAGANTNLRFALFNAGQSPQLFLRCVAQSPIRCRTRREGERRWVGLCFEGEMTLEIAPENLVERQRLTAMLKELEEALQKESWARVCRLAGALEEQFKTQFAEAGARAAQAQERMKETFAKVKQDLDRELAGVRQYPNTADQTAGRIQNLLPPWRETPHEEEFKSALAQIEQIKKSASNAAREKDAQALLVNAQRHVDLGEDSLAVGISLCKRILRDFEGTQTAGAARDLLAKAEKAKERYDKLKVITDNLRAKVAPFLQNSDFAKAIGTVENDEEFKKNKDELRELNELLRAWRRKLEQP
jgi:pSer/pThr/pTyr-binding forkhead associated (FHA) protein